MVLHDMYGNAPRRAFAGELNDLGDEGTEIYLALLSVNYTPDRSAHETWDDVSADEITNDGDSNDDGYTSGGQEVNNKSLSESNNMTTFDGDDVTWEDSTIDAGYAILYDDTPTDDVDKSLLTLVDFEGEESSEDGDFTIEWDDDGIFQIDAS